MTDAKEQECYDLLVSERERTIQQAERIARLESELTSLRAEGKKCTWKMDEWYSVWGTSCGNQYKLVAGTPRDNSMKFCPYCANLIDEPQPNSGGE